MTLDCHGHTQSAGSILFIGVQDLSYPLYWSAGSILFIGVQDLSSLLECRIYPLYWSAGSILFIYPLYIIKTGELEAVHALPSPTPVGELG